MKRFQQCWMSWLGFVVLSGQVVLADDKLTPDQLTFFESKIRPVLSRECYSCHSAQVGQIKGGLWLDTADGSRTGGDSGPAIVPGNLDESLLWNAINHIDYSMPPRKKLSDEVLADFRTWIEMGAPDPRSQSEASVQSTISAADIEQGREFWSFQKPHAQTVPVSDSTWPMTDIDQFVLEKLASHDLRPAPDAEPAILLRRLCFDLVGLPPTPEQLKRFETDWQLDSQAALEKVVDELLAQPQFGERWGRHWLDVARFAESTGKELNLTFPHAWRYRDYVIDAFNSDKPYSQFLQEQIAGDLLPVKSDQQWASNLVATGFLALGPKTLTEKNPRQFELDLIDEQIDVTTRVMLGVSVACARCHDHKFDPIPQTDYYALAGIFRSMSTHFGTFETQQNRRATNLVVSPVADLGPLDKPISKQQLDDLRADLETKRAELRTAYQERRMQQTNPANAKGKPGAGIAQVGLLSTAIGMLEAKINSYDENGKPLTYCMAVQATAPVNARLLERGEFNQPAQEVERGFPQVLCEQPISISKKSTGRLEFARWVGSAENPLTARVMANRVWLHLFGNGIVRTPEDFGTTGTAPSHPELLDHLAIELMENNWSIKGLIRSLVLSRTYRTSSRFDQASFEKDPENNFLWRIEPKRLEAEVLRDSMLAISGKLDTDRPRGSLVAQAGQAIVRDGILVSAVATGEAKMNEPPRRFRAQNGGPMSGDNSLRPTIQSLDEPTNYRSVYLPIVRDNVPRSLDVFDFAESTMVIGQRETSNTPDQGLYFLNNKFVIEQADVMAKRLLDQSTNVNEQLEQAFVLAYGRPATSSELRAANSFYRSFRPTSSTSSTGAAKSGNALRGGRDQGLEKLSAVCQAIMASAEFRFLN